MYPEEKGHYANQRKAIQEGCELHYNEVTEHLSEGLTTEECSFFLDVVDMYAAFHYSYHQLKEPKILTEQAIRFPQFDGNNEAMQLAYTSYLLDDLDKFSEIQDENKGRYRCGARMIPKYKSMIPKWKAVKQPMTYSLSEEQVIKLLNTRPNQ